MKFVLEYGNRGGKHVDNCVIATKSLATQLAANITMVLQNKVSPETKRDWWLLSDYEPRKSWVSDTHFVALSRLDGTQRGCASARLWQVTA